MLVVSQNNMKKLLCLSVLFNIILALALAIIINQDISITSDKNAEKRLLDAMALAIAKGDEEGIKQAYNYLLFYKIANNKSK